MGRETDFLDLYKDLGLHPDCSLPEFKQAYRRRLSVLHPDRPGDGSANPPEQLQRLTALYGAAMEFHRRHDRLPGAIQSRPVQVSPAQPPASAPVAPPRQRSRWWLALPLVACAIWLLWPESPKVESTMDSDPQVEATESGQPGAVPAHAIELGMAPDQVRAIEGEPVVISDDRWDYGPSWVRFENRKVAGWYSSVLHPLKTASPQNPQIRP
ncbi:MAG: hypothetical protein ABI870_03770 [Rhodanobacter sp.]